MGFKKTLKNLGRKSARVGSYALPIAGGLVGGVAGAAIGGAGGAALSQVGTGNKKLRLKRSLMATGASIAGSGALGLASGQGVGASGLSSIGALFGGGGSTLAPRTGGLSPAAGQQGTSPFSTGGQAVPESTDVFSRFGAFLGRAPGKIGQYLGGAKSPTQQAQAGGVAGGSFFGAPGSADANQAPGATNFLPLLLIGGGLLAVFALRKGK